MARHEQIKDEGLRALMDEAHRQLRQGKATDAVHTLSDAFVSMLRDHPELVHTATVVRGRKMPLVARWPAYGANLIVDPGGRDEPRIEYIRDRFATSEALTYYEFTVDTALSQGL